MKFKVLRAHYGDRDYAEGDEREASEADVAHLVASGVLAPAGAAKSDAQKVKDGEMSANEARSRAGRPPIGAEAKDAGPAPRNKAMGAAPENKAEAAPRARKAE